MPFVILSPLPALAQEKSGQPPVELNVGTSTTQTSSPETLPPPPLGVRQISLDTDPAATLDQPLSLMGEDILQAVCDAQIDPQKALALMPDLSEAHIRATCPKRLTSKLSS
ncbi:MAG: hypothetical protein NW237_03005 [Cyanobacteriota bacterium]|nr:hypothetical protein [Cyanobacteriota bacterium]